MNFQADGDSIGGRETRLFELALGLTPVLIKQEGPTMITGPQCRAARALVEVSRAKLARRSAVDESVIEEFERMIDDPGPEKIGALETALQDLGAVFIEENGGGIGVRLKFTYSEAKRIAHLEGEGGIVASDRVP